MKVGDLVKMGDPHPPFPSDEWGMGVIVEVTDRTPDDVCVLWSKLNAESWELKTMLEVIDESG